MPQWQQKQVQIVACIVHCALGPDIIGSRTTLGVDSYSCVPSARPALSFPNFFWLKSWSGPNHSPSFTLWIHPITIDATLPSQCWKLHKKFLQFHPFCLLSADDSPPNPSKFLKLDKPTWRYDEPFGVLQIGLFWNSNCLHGELLQGLWISSCHFCPLLALLCHRRSFKAVTIVIFF